MAVRTVKGRVSSVPARDGLVLLALCFALGALIGFLFSGWVGCSQELQEHLQRRFQAAGQGHGAQPSVWACVWDLARWPAVAVLLGSTAAGAVGVPLLLGARGFLLAYAASVLVRLFGLPGLAASAASLGVTALLAVPVLFAVSAVAFRQSLGRLSGERPLSWAQTIQELTPCAGLLVLAAALQQTLMPALLAAACARLFPA